MTTVTFEVGTLADAVREANAIAPTKGKDLDQMAGFFFEIRPDAEGGGVVFLRCTNRSIYYTKQVEVVKIEGIDQDWRVPSIPMNGVLSALPVGAGRHVTLNREVIEDKNSASGYRYTNRIRIECGRTKASVLLIPTEAYPEWEPFDPTDLPMVHNFGERIEQVGWAVANEGGEPLTGVYMDGTRLIATDRFRVATTGCEADLGENDPITVPMNLLGPILKQIQDVRIGIFGNFLCIAPNDYTQIKIGTYQENLPDMSRIMNMEHEETVLLQREPTVAAVQRVLSIGATDRQIALHVTIGNGELALYLEGEGQTETAEDAVYLQGQADHDPVEYKFGPQNFLDSISKAPSSEIMFHYNRSTTHAVVKFETSSGYTVWSMPRRGIAKKSET